MPVGYRRACILGKPYLLMRALSIRLLILLGLTAVLGSCKEVKENLQVESVADYVALQPGKYITYRLDSTVFTQQGRSVEIHSYQEKHVIDAQFMDNTGRTSYRVFRYLRDTAGTGGWNAAGTYVITPLANSIEVIEDNMRVVKLITPIKEGNTWKGNRYLGFEPYASRYSFVNDDFMPDWEFTYTSTQDVFTYNQQELTGVVTVLQTDEQYALDTVMVVGNTATLPANTTGVWLRGTVNVNDTIRINAQVPEVGKEQLTIYNRTNAYATLNGIAIPPGLALYFEFSGGRWYYPNPLTVKDNRVTFPKNASLAYIFDPQNTATDNITVDVISQVDTNQTKRITIYNKSNFDAYPNFPNSTVSIISIPPGYGRSYELYEGQWRFYENRDALLEQDPYISDLPFGTTSYSVEKYAKGIGMVFQELILWEYQPNQGGTAYQVGFGVKRSMIDHN
jgi:hypothetical protein